MVKTKIKLRVCDICGEKKRVTEFSAGKICNKCETIPIENASTLQESTDDEADELHSKVDSLHTRMDNFKVDTRTDNLQSLHTKVDDLTKRFDKMEVLLLGLMDLVGKMNYEMEINKAKDDE